VKRSSAMELIHTLGFDPKEVSALILRGDELEIREKSPSKQVWYVTQYDYDVEDLFDNVSYDLQSQAPVPLGGIETISLDWRGITVQSLNGLRWQIPWG
jgi:hypothetical protein